MNFKIKLKRLISDFNSEKDLNKRVLIAEEYNCILKRNVHLMEHPYNAEIPEREVWRNIKGYEGIYQVSNYGNIKSLERFFIKNRKGGKSRMAVYLPEKIKNKNYNPNGYLNMYLWDKGYSEHVLIHRIVAIYFIPNIDNHPQVLHKDDNPKNARWDNLEWGTQSKNIQDAANRGRGFRGSKNGMAKLKDEDIPHIRKLISEGVPSRKIAKMFGVTKTPILWIRNNKSWIDIK